MKGDFTRNTFDPLRHFSRVLMQQGRVQVDADWNEQADIALHGLRSLAADLIGPHGGPGASFLVQQRANGDGQGAPFDFSVGAGHYYVAGILCESEGAFYTAQPALPPITEGAFLAYLDVWERHLTHLEADGVREPALGGPDTATRTRVEWQVRLAPLPQQGGVDPLAYKTDFGAFRNFLLDQGLYQLNEGALMAALPASKEVFDACLVAADKRYRGVENQLYRVEIHRGGLAWDGSEGGRTTAATFKWSRENGCVVFGVQAVHVNGASDVTTVTLDDLGRDRKLGLARDDWVELVDDETALRNDAAPLLRVLEIDRDSMTVTLQGQAAAGVGNDRGRHPLLRRWDQRVADAARADDGAPLAAADASSAGLWLKLEDGIAVRFQAGVRYNTGDYWLIPARSASGDIEWPRQANPANPADPDTVRPAWLRPRGVAHRYAPLAALGFDGNGNFLPGSFIDLRRALLKLWE